MFGKSATKSFEFSTGNICTQKLADVDFLSDLNENKKFFFPVNHIIIR